MAEWRRPHEDVNDEEEQYVDPKRPMVDRRVDVASTHDEVVHRRLASAHNQGKLSIYTIYSHKKCLCDGV